ncbi:uncharacterized protein LOC128555258 [Mercenaria mercenaria]|uniref:uncharacterized protein LOC128555258 n=1 Tax=Mercenaria mercenaria TaxID=6596 RepID=UPI00234F4B41|nr:uncharacterized protein LOC128555258 [Mercenaria mercenaria]
MPNRLALGKLVKHYHDETGTADGTAKLPDNNLCETPKATNVFFKPSRPEHPKDKSVRRRTARYSKCHLMPLFNPKQDKIYGWKHGEPGAQAAHFANVSECKTFSQTCQDPMQTGNPEAHKALSNTLSSKPMTKEMNYPSVAKCHSETTLSDIFDISCCLKNNSDERSLSSPPHGRDHRLTSNENKH